MDMLSCKRNFQKYYPPNNEAWAKVFFQLMRFGFCFYILFFPIGIALREIGATISLIGLISYYILNYNNSNLKRFKLKWIYFLFFAFLIFKMFHSIDFETSWYGIRTNLHKAFILIFVGMEFVRGLKDLKILVALFAIMGCYEGLDGVYQYFSGVDLIKGTKIMGGRLTGSLSTFRVGNLMSLVLPISLALYVLLPDKWSKLKKLLLTSFVLAPGTFLFLEAKARSGYVGFFTACVALIFLFKGFSWKKTLAFCTILIWALCFVPERTSFQHILDDGRVKELWPFGIEVFKHYPLLGVGINGYNPGFRSLGLVPKYHSLGIPHPHNIYIQFACETGIVGLSLLLFFFASYLIWSLKRIRKGLQTKQKTYWIITSFFWSSFLGYTATAFSAHNFFRTWWLGMAFSILGILIGSSLGREEQIKN